MERLIAEKAGPARRRESDEQRHRELGLRRSRRVAPSVLAEHREHAAQVPTEREAVGLSKAHRERTPRIAIIYARRATELAARSPLAWTALAASQRRAGDVDDALQSTRHSVYLESELSRNPYGYTALLATLADLGKPDEELTDRLEARDTDGFAQNAAGRALRLLGHLDRAERCFARAIEFRQGEADAKKGLRTFSRITSFAATRETPIGSNATSMTSSATCKITADVSPLVGSGGPLAALASAGAGGEKQLARDLKAAGYDVMNEVRWNAPLDEKLYEPVRAAFAAEFPGL